MITFHTVGCDRVTQRSCPMPASDKKQSAGFDGCHAPTSPTFVLFGSFFLAFHSAPYQIHQRYFRHSSQSTRCWTHLCTFITQSLFVCALFITLMWKFICLYHRLKAQDCGYGPFRLHIWIRAWVSCIDIFYLFIFISDVRFMGTIFFQSYSEFIWIIHSWIEWISPSDSLTDRVCLYIWKLFMYSRLAKQQQLYNVRKLMPISLFSSLFLCLGMWLLGRPRQHSSHFLRLRLRNPFIWTFVISSGQWVKNTVLESSLESPDVKHR